MYKILLFLYKKLFVLKGGLIARFHSIFLKKVWKFLTIQNNVKIGSPRTVSIGTNVFINEYCQIYGGEDGVDIGDFVMFARNVKVFWAMHSYDDPTRPMVFQGYFSKKVIIQDDVWIGENVVIMPGVTIGKWSIVGANAVVTKDVEVYSIVWWVPAKLIKKRFSDEEIILAKKQDFSMYSDRSFLG